MADNFLHDDIVRNILARLPAKSLLRSRCVSRHWNCMIREPSFMKLRSRKTIFLALKQTKHLIHDTLPIEHTHNSIDYTSPSSLGQVIVIGTVNGIVLLFYHPNYVLYNPFTRVSKKLPSPPYDDYSECGYGFGYGAKSDDLKFVIFGSPVDRIRYVYNLRENLWSSWIATKYIVIEPNHRVGTFANGFLYWPSMKSNVLIVLDLNTMLLSEMNLPFQKSKVLLGTLNGCLCALHNHTTIKFDMWVIKEENQWSKLYSFKLSFDGTPLNNVPFRGIPLRHNPATALCILDSGRILFLSPSWEVIIFDPMENLYNSLNISLKLDYKFNKWNPPLKVLEYEESLFSPSDICPLRGARFKCRYGDIFVPQEVRKNKLKRSGRTN